MKTIFKVGMEVYDQIVFPDKKGKVVKIEEDDNYPIKVSLGDSKIIWCYTKDGRHGANLSPTLSTSSYTIKGFEQKAPVPTFEEVIKDARSKGDYYYLHGLEAPSEELAEATMALLKLLFLRDYYNEGWKPDWDNDKVTKCTIENASNNLIVTNEITFSRPLYFKTELLAEKFLEEQKELLEIAKPLL